MGKWKEKDWFERERSHTSLLMQELIQSTLSKEMKDEWIWSDDEKQRYTLKPTYIKL